MVQSPIPTPEIDTHVRPCLIVAHHTQHLQWLQDPPFLMENEIFCPIAILHIVRLNLGNELGNQLIHIHISFHSTSCSNRSSH